MNLTGYQLHTNEVQIYIYIKNYENVNESFKKLSCDKLYKLYKVLKLLKHLRCSVFVANILNQNNTHIKNCEIVKTCMEGM